MIEIIPIPKEKIKEGQIIEIRQNSYTTVPPPKYYLTFVVFFFVVFLIALAFTKSSDE